MKLIIGHSTLWSTLVLALLTLSGCGQKQPPPIAGNPATLKAECATMYTNLTAIGSGYFTGPTYPPTIATLAPQFVRIHSDSPPAINIQTSGGFYHAGYIVVLATNALHKPSQKWLRKEVSPGIWEYRE